MNFDNLNNIRNSLFTAIEDAKLAVNTDQFSSKAEIVNQIGLQFALEAGALSQDERLQIEDLFSTTVLNKRQIIDMMIRILGVEVFNYGPGPQELIGGDMTNGYFGEVSAEELFTGAELSSLLEFSNGTLINSDTTWSWLKFARYDNIIYIAKRPVRRSISWNHLNDQNVIYGNNPDLIVEKDGNEFVPRLITGGISDPSPLEGDGSEWNELMYNVHVDNPNQLDEPWDLFNNSDLRVGGGDGRWIYCQETNITNLGRIITRGGTSIIGRSDTTTGYINNAYGWRPVLALKQEDGSYSTGREHYPE